ncbi:MAG: hypothetical protein ABH886_02760 [Candidatus Desantisbacteria bacterium]
MPVNTFEEALEKVKWYATRWWIEIYHKTLKSGCKIERRQLGKASRIESCLAIDMVIAWRIFRNMSRIILHSEKLHHEFVSFSPSV